MQYQNLAYFALFLPCVLFLYQRMPQKKRPYVLLLASWFFQIMLSGALLIANIAETLLAHHIGLWLGVQASVNMPHEARKKKVHGILAVGILVSVGMLIAFKYTDFFAETGVYLANQLFHAGLKYKKLRLIVPIGISYYTLQAVSYMTDVARGTIHPEQNLSKLALYFSFFPQIEEGPITRYSEIGGQLSAGRPTSFQNVIYGYQRILWGLFKKVVIADRMAVTVAAIFNKYTDSGSISLLGAVLFTLQLYMDFSGTIDIALGSAETFGFHLAENFRQPFFARDASDFWRRWHITLGTWMRDYVFYPVCLSHWIKNKTKKVRAKFGKNAAKFTAPFYALLAVWLLNGFWHGPNWTYVLYGIYYFVLIFLENVLDEPVGRLLQKLRINREGLGCRIFRRIKLLLIVVTGEMFFRASTFANGWRMLVSIFTRFDMQSFSSLSINLGMDWLDYCVVLAGTIIVYIVDLKKEHGADFRQSAARWNKPVRIGFWYALILVIVVFGAYGAGYDSVAMMYAGF